MVILGKPYGGLSNRLFQHIHFDSFCRENGVVFYTTFMSDFWRGIPKLLWELPRFRTLKFTSAEADYSEAERLMLNRPLAFVEGWAYRNKPLVQKYRDFYRRSLYEAKPPVDARSILATDRINIAVHIRRGDYAIWLKGKYFYPDAVYISAIEQILSLIGAKAQIAIFTDDRSLNRGAFRAAFDRVIFPGSTSHADHYLMSHCDYIVGPPSTFSMWASYIGQTMYCHINSPSDVISQDSFGICQG